MKEKDRNCPETPEQIREIGRLLGMINNSISQKIKHSDAFRQAQDLSRRNGKIIEYLFQHQDRPIYQKELEKEFNITRSTASKVLILMEKKGYIQRRGVSDDARLKQIVLTEKSKGLVEGIVATIEDTEKTLKQGFSPEELELLTSYMNRILQNLKTD